MVMPIGQSNPIEQFTPGPAGAAIAAQFHRYRDVLDRGQCRDKLKVLKNEPDVLITNPCAFVFADVTDGYAVQNH